MNFTSHRRRLILLGAAFAQLLVASVVYRSAARARIQANVTGTWKAAFHGVVQGTGSLQTDDFVLQIQQNGRTVEGTLRVSGHDMHFPLSGEVQGTTFTYTVRGSLEPNCELTVEAKVTVDSTAGRMNGAQTQSTCEGTAVGEITAGRL